MSTKLGKSKKANIFAKRAWPTTTNMAATAKAHDNAGNNKREARVHARAQRHRKMHATKRPTRPTSKIKTAAEIAGTVQTAVSAGKAIAPYVMQAIRIGTALL